MPDSNVMADAGQNVETSENPTPRWSVSNTCASRPCLRGGSASATMGGGMDGVGLTSLWVAAMRAVESERQDALFRDPFARALAGERGFEILERSHATTSVDVPVIPVRTKWIDDTIRATHLDQLVILAAGMDARAFRLDLAGRRVFEVDRDFVLDTKRERLGGAKARCERVEVPVDLRDDWPAALGRAGFDATRPALWLAEGLLPYLEEAHVRSLFARIDACSANGSEMLFEIGNRAMLTSSYMTARLEFVRDLGAPWIFGADDPKSLVPSGWDATADDFADVGARYGRWPFAPIPPDAPPEMLAAIPRSYLVHATKRS